MNRNLFLVLPLALLAVFGATLSAGGVALAHGTTEVGDYQLVIGFHNEPAYAGEPNGLDLFVTNKNTQENINGLEKTLKVEIIRGTSRKELPIRAQFGQEGAYTADLVPTEAGDYTWHIFGTINDTPVDVSMESGPETFSPVQAKADTAFPAAEPTSADLKAQVDSAAATAQTALILGGLGTLSGLVGIVVGLMGMRARSASVAVTRQGTTVSGPQSGS
jgi:hypothetical protein